VVFWKSVPRRSVNCPGRGKERKGALNPSSQHSTMLNSRWRGCDGEEAQGVLGG
jgi:hypothetical protein